jgi:hypothetical protein
MGPRHAWLAVVGGSLLLCACGSEWDEPIGSTSLRVAHPGPWVIPEATSLIGDSQTIEYTSAGPWVGESGCSGSLTPGAGILREYLYEHFAQTPHIGGYSCRSINGDDTMMSVHGTGRALDVMIPLDGDEADNDLGDPVGNFLIENAQAIGIQYIIWDLWTWRGDRDPGAKDKAYGGAHPHHDHLHIELSVAASENTTLWFVDQVTPPAIEGCDPVPAEGGIIDDTSACFRTFGSADYWRVEEGVGYDDRMLWTNAFEADSPSNWARWHLSFDQAGTYELELFLDPAFAVADGVRYDVSFGGETETIYVDQSSAEGWHSLGSFDFDEGLDQHVDVFDDQPGPVPDDQHIAVDAIRLTGEGQPPPDDPGNPFDPPGLSPNDPSDPSATGLTGDNEGCGCRLAGGHGNERNAGAAVWLALLACGWLRRRRS